MHEADIVLNLALVAHHDAAMAQQPAVQTLNLPAPLVAAQPPTILCLRLS